MLDTLKFNVTIGVTDRKLLREHAETLGSAKGKYSIAKVAIAITNPCRKPSDTGFEIVACKATSATDDDVNVFFECRASDVAAILTEARSCYFDCWQDREWSPSSIEEALYEILVASNANPSPDECGFEIAEFLPVGSTPFPPAPSFAQVADQFYRLHTGTVDTLVERIKLAGLSEEDLDELIHEAAENDRYSSEDASDLNNQGLTFQVAAILEGNGIEGGSRIILGIAELSAQAPKR